MEEINVNEIVKIESMAVIKAQLDNVEKIIEEKVKDIPKQLEKIKKMSFVEQEEEKGDIKKYQQYLSNLLKQLEDKRKDIKKEINKPYEEFNEYYTNGVFTKLNNGIQQIKDVVNEIETLQKDEKENELREFATQYIKANNLEDIITFEDIGLNITLSASIKSLKEQTLAFVKKVNDDLECISSDENRDEVLYEYMHNGFNYQNAILTTRKKHEEINKLQEHHKEVQMVIDEESNVVEKVEEVLPPKEIITITFTITDTKENIIKVREFMKKEGIKYE